MTLKRLSLHAFLTLGLLPLTLAVHAQDSNLSDCSKLPNRIDQAKCEETHSQVKTIFLKNITSQTDANEVMVAIRNSFDHPGLHIFLVTTQNALVIATYPEEFAKIEALVNTLDRPHKTFRLAYTITELEAGKSIGTEHIAMVAVDGQRTTVKQGDKIPVATGSYSNGEATTAGTAAVQTQFTYLDIGLNFDATLSALENGAMLKTKVEQSSLGQPSTIAGVTEPVVRQTVLEGNTLLTLGKPVLIGSIDVPNSTHRFDIAVVMDPIK